MNEDALKALLDEAITYKCPKDREHKSATFNVRMSLPYQIALSLAELLSKTEREDQEQNFSFTSRPVHSKRASARPTQGGSLQDITEATKQEYGYTEYCSGSSFSHKRHGGGGHGGFRSKRQISSVSSRQREGGSLPSNVNETTTPSYISEQPFLNEVRRPLKSTSAKFSTKSNDYGALLRSAPLNAIGASDWSGIGGLAAGEESQSNATAGEIGVGSTNFGFQRGGGVIGSGPGTAAHTIINMGELDSDEGPSSSRGFREMFSGHANNALQQKAFCYSKPQYTTQACLEIGQATNLNRPSSMHHVDTTVPLPMLETVQLGSTYPAVKCMIDSSKVDQSTMKSVLSSSNQFISTTRSSLTYPTIQQKFDENANSVSQFGGSGSGGGGIGASSSGNQMGVGGNAGSGSGSKKPRKPKSDRNTV
uniref:Uncharacterized protein n=1 Tax=Anopheles maculatus TaxID=74869 RepID=A0A182SFH2_9DIPT